MSMNYGVYVGPFLKCEGGKDVDVYELLNDRLMDERGELANEDGEVQYLAPNVNYGLGRQDRFSRMDQVPVVMRINQEKELAFFQQFFATDIEMIRGLFGSVSVEWGVVPSYR